MNDGKPGCGRVSKKPCRTKLSLILSARRAS
jgi:hypothetical protein